MSFISNLLGANNNYTVQNGLPTGATASLADPNQYKDLISAGAGNYNKAAGTQNSLAQALLAQVNGGGPNLANAQLQAATNQNIAQGAGMINSQRGISPALAAQLIARHTAGANQAAAQQSSVNRMQGQLTAENGLANLSGTMAGQGLAAAGGGANALNAQNGLITGATTDASKANAGIAGQNAQMAGQIGGGLFNAAGAALGMGGGGPSGSPVGNSANIMSGAGPAMMLAAEGGEVPAANLTNQIGNLKEKLSKRKVPDHIMRIASMRYPKMAYGGELQAKGGKVEAKPGQKAEAKGNSYSNDKVPAMLSEKEIVLPRSITMSPNAPELARQFVANLKGGKRG